MSYPNLGGPNAPQLPITTGTVRAFNTNFQVNLSRPTLVLYSVQMEHSTLGFDEFQVELRSDQGNPPTTTRAIVGGGGDGSNGGFRVTALLCYIVPAGHFVRMKTNGAGTFTFLAGTEIVL